MIGDEVSFHLTGQVNTHNVRHYAPKDGEHPSFNFDKNRSRDKLSVWAGVCGNGALLGPFFFQMSRDERIWK